MKAILTALFISLLPLQTFACSVCFSGKEDFLEAFYFTTALLIVLPPTLLASFIYMLRRYIKKAHAEAQLEQ